MTIRLAHTNDLDSIVGILNQATLAGRQNGRLTTVSADDMLSWFSQFNTTDHPLLVSEEEDGTISGWLSISAYRPGREALRRTAEISYYVDQQYHGRGIGSHLMEEALRRCSSAGLRVLVGFLLQGNVASIGLLRKYGFEQWGLFPRAAEIEGSLVDQLCYGKVLQEDSADHTAKT